MKIKTLIYILFIVMLSSCKGDNPKKIFIEILQNAQNAQKDKIMEIIRPDNWIGEIKPDGSYMSPEETVNLLVDVMKDREIKSQDNIEIYNADKDMIVLDYDDGNIVRGVSLSIMIIFVRIEGKYFISTMEISCGECKKW